MTSYPKRLIEVDLPIKQISAHARREKSIRHGHISTLHIWWARRPLAACRAVICASLWLDPADENCPPYFREEAIKIITEFAKKVDRNENNLASKHCSTENWEKWQVLAKDDNKLSANNPSHLNILRYRLLDFIADFANWDNSTQPDYLETSRLLTQVAHEANGGIPDTKPLVVDPFAGGGAIPLEALRVGADAFASDLNPVAVLLNKVVLEYIPKYGQTLADEVRKWGQWVKQEAEKELSQFYPKSPHPSVNQDSRSPLTPLNKGGNDSGDAVSKGGNGSSGGNDETPIAYLWARTIISEAPDDGTGIPVEVPLMRSMWLAKKKGKNKALRWVRDAQGMVVTEDDFIQAFISDPPYYDAIPYSDLSDFFYVWLKRSLPQSLKSTFSSELTPKEEECIVDPVKGKDKAYFEKQMGKAMAEGCRILSPNGIGVIVFAHKSTAGWEAQLQAMVNAGWTITASWAIDTEKPDRLRAMNSAALASSIHLVCRPRNPSPRPNGHPSPSGRGEGGEGNIGDWRDILQELPVRIREWLPRLASEGVVGADAIFACLGPALEIYSRYDSVEKASGEVVTLREYLEQVGAVVSQEALTMIFSDVDTSGLEEDARLTAMWLWTLSTDTTDTSDDSAGDSDSEEEEEEENSSKSKKISGFSLEYDAARKIAQGLGVHLEALTTLVEIKGDKARLLPVTERAEVLLGKKKVEIKPNKKKKQDTLTITGMEDYIPEDTTDNDGLELTNLGNTVLDQIHLAMLLFASGRSEALKTFLVDEGVGRRDRFWKLANALSALYPSSSDEKRWVDGVLARKKGLGF